MIDKTLTPPEHYSADVAYKAMLPLRGFIDAALPKLVTGLTAVDSRALFKQFSRIAENLTQTYTSGSIDGSAEWKAKVGGVLADLGSINAVAAPIQQKYSNLVGQTIADETTASLSTEEAGALVVFDQADIDAIVEAINLVLEA